MSRVRWLTSQLRAAYSPTLASSRALTANPAISQVRKRRTSSPLLTMLAVVMTLPSGTSASILRRIDCSPAARVTGASRVLTTRCALANGAWAIGS